jgi:CheY-like chemotaxis protein
MSLVTTAHNAFSTFGNSTEISVHVVKIDQSVLVPREQNSSGDLMLRENENIRDPKNRILIVDDEPGVRTTISMLLAGEGYETSTAEDGFDALLHLRSSVPEVIISDLNMPRMSGFEFLSVVRGRFPQVKVLAMSGVYHARGAVPGGVLADAFYAKGMDSPSSIVRLVAELMASTVPFTTDKKNRSAPVWVPNKLADSRGESYVVLTCLNCLRSFPLNVSPELKTDAMQTHCMFCMNEVEFSVDFTHAAMASPSTSSQMTH